MTTDQAVASKTAAPRLTHLRGAAGPVCWHSLAQARRVDRGVASLAHEWPPTRRSRALIRRVN
jgi:hypothetical protein